MRFLASEKFKAWSLNVCAIIFIISAISRFFVPYKSVVDFILYVVMALFFLSQAFVKVEKAEKKV